MALQELVFPSTISGEQIAFYNNFVKLQYDKQKKASTKKNQQHLLFKDINIQKIRHNEMADFCPCL
jgi:hypothetical protein